MTEIELAAKDFQEFIQKRHPMGRVKHIGLCELPLAAKEIIEAQEAQIAKLREQSGALVHLAWLMERFDVETVEELCAKLVPRPLEEAGHGSATAGQQEHAARHG
jgi:alpha-galactosidase/6-phospho-beta-glucosidase family protein